MQQENNSPRPEHIGLNVPNPTVMVAWYVTHLNMTVVRHFPTPANTHFVMTGGNRLLLEFYRNGRAPILDFASLGPLSFHLAFMTTDMPTHIEELTAAGAVVTDDVTTTPDGDQILMMRDPWGLAIQFVQRADPMLAAGKMRLEHIAWNIPDPQAQCSWYCRNLQMKVLRSGPPPTHTSFLADAGENLVLEMYSNHAFPMLKWNSIQPLSIHLAFSVTDVTGTRDAMLSAGASLCEDQRMIDSGDQLLMMRDPWGVPVQFVKRALPMI